MLFPCHFLTSRVGFCFSGSVLDLDDGLYDKEPGECLMSWVAEQMLDCFPIEFGLHGVCELGGTTRCKDVCRALPRSEN